MAVRTSWSAGQVLTSADLTDTFAAKAATSSVGLTKVSVQAFTSVSSVIVNSCFTSTYENYRINIVISGVTSDALIWMKLRKSGSDSSTGYFVMMPTITSANSAYNTYVDNGSNGVFITEVDSGGNSANYSSSIDIFRPFVSGRTPGTANFSGSRGTDGAGIGGAGGFIHTVSDTFDGISLIASAGQITGRLSIFGYAL